MIILPQKFSVSVDYDNPNWGANADARKSDYFVNAFKGTGTQNVTIQLIRFYGTNMSISANSSQQSSLVSMFAAQGYRPATAAEMAALNNQYPLAREFESNVGTNAYNLNSAWNKTIGNYGDGMLSLGTWNDSCMSTPAIVYWDGHFDDRGWGFVWPATIPILYPVVKI